MDSKDINTYLQNLTTFFNKNGEPDSELIIDDSLSNNKECFYIFDFTLGKIVYHKGFDKVFGYSNSEVSYELILQKYHPEEKETILRIFKATISHCLSKPFECVGSLLHMTYQLMNNDGTYLKVLSHSSAYKINKEGFMTRILVKFTDISFLENTEYIKWDFKALNLNEKKFKEYIYSAFKDFFTNQEINIIQEIAKGHSSKIIGNNLHISEHTVATHRKNILKKSEKHNVDDLILFCKRKGII